MEKKLYNSPLTEVVKVNLRGCLLDSSPAESSTTPVPPHPGAPKRWTEVF